ncbi:MAG TPA: FAD-binding oxidoreductase [Candidatus Dormibacteraeota bacterium]|nr:FAD-binding oxidoreductase [Candidatus Dormibacteraeota bacterium]
MTQVIDSEVIALRADVGGTVLRPDDEGYDGARSIWNGSIDRRPAIIVRCANAADVAAAIAFGREHGLEIAVRGGGHSFAGSSVCEGGLMIDLSAIDHVVVDPGAKRAVCGGGATWAAVDAATQAHGLAVPGGTISHTGIGGLTLGGGFGWLVARAGLSADNLISAEAVTADGRRLVASATEHPELFWAIRGGGGNFGVVTSFEFQLHEVGPLVNLGLFFWTADRCAEGLRYARDFVHTLPDDMGVLIVGMNAPPAPFVPEQYHFAPGVAVAIAGFGSEEEHRRAVQPLRDQARPTFELVTPIPYVNLQQMLDDSAPWGIQAYDKSLYLPEFTDEAIDVFAERLVQRQSPMSLIVCFRMNGAYTRPGEDDTAFGGPRTACYSIDMAGLTQAPEALDAERAWARSFWEALRRSSSGSGTYVNFMAEYEQDRVRASYGPAKYERLAGIKRQYDPDNVFHLNANIEPA